jgi:hypothetical protein
VIAEALNCENPPAIAFRGAQVYVIGRSRFKTAISDKVLASRGRMPRDHSQEKLGSLEALAKTHFPRRFTKAERTLLAKVPLGQFAYCGARHDPKDSSNDPSKAEKSEGNPGWEPHREIDARLIRWLCIEPKASEQVDPEGIQIQAAKITGSLDLDFVTVQFPIYFRNCAFTEDAWLQRANIAALVLQGTWTRSIHADGATVKGGVSLSDGFRADGEVQLVDAQIGDLECHGGTFNNPDGDALSADRAEVMGGVFLNNNFNARGAVRLLGARIGGNLECDGGSFNNPAGYALSAERASVKGNILLNDGFNARGIVDLLGCHIEGDLSLRGKFKEATLDLIDVSASVVRDDAKTWPQPGQLLLDGFVYGRIADGPKDAETRLQWLRLQPQFATQPYLQLAKVLKEAGDDTGAETVLKEMERRLRQQADGNRLDRRAMSWLFKESIGYGYNPGRAIWGILALSGLGWILYRRSYLAGGMVPTEKDAYLEFECDGQTPKSYEKFYPLVYGVENSLPLVKLGHTDKWQPDPNLSGWRLRKRKWVSTAGRLKVFWGPWPGQLRWLERLLIFVGLLAPVDRGEPPSRFSRFGTSPRFLRWFVWVQILLGWLLATLFLAGVTGIVRKE